MIQAARVARGVALVALLASHAGCGEIVHADAFGAPCTDDGDCAEGTFCGGNAEGARTCIPAGACDGAFGEECLGDGILFCNADQEIDYFDCGDTFGAAADNELTCGVAPCAGDDCSLDPVCIARESGDVCFDAGAAAFLERPTLCSSLELACVLDVDTGLERCRDLDVDVCTAAPVDTCVDDRVVRCDGERAMPTVVDCGAAACRVSAGTAVCEMQDGDPCDDGLRTCDEGLRCNGFDAGGRVLGICEPL